MKIYFTNFFSKRSIIGKFFLRPDSASKEVGLSSVFPALASFLLASVLPIMIVLLNTDAIGRGNILNLYVMMVIIVSIIFIILLASLWWICRKNIIVNRFIAGYVVLIGPFNILFLALTVNGAISITDYIRIFVASHLVFLIFGWLGSNSVFTKPVFLKLNRWVIYLMPVGYAGIFWFWLFARYWPAFMASYYYPGIIIGILVIFFCLTFVFWILSTKFPHAQWRSQASWIIYLLVAIILIGLIYRPNLYFDRHHYNFFLAPVNDVLNGRILFVSSTSQYGFGSIYFIALFFRLFHMPVFYTGLSALLCLLYILYYLVITLVLHKTTNHLIFSLMGLAAIVYFNYLSVNWPSMLRIPAQSPLRYGFSYLILLLALRRGEYHKRVWLILEIIVLVIASFWSLESFLYTIIPLIVFDVINDIYFALEIKSGILGFIKRLVLQFGAVLISWGIAYLLFLVFAKQVPNLAYYFEYFGAYIPTNTHTISLNFFDFWSGAVIAVYLLSIYFVFYLRSANGRTVPDLISRKKVAMIASISVLGLLQYTYYFVYNLDFHLALLCVPLIIILLLWASTLDSNEIPRPLRLSLITVMIFSFSLCALLTMPAFREKISASLFANITSSIEGKSRFYVSNPYIAQPTNENVSNLVALIHKYAGDEQQIVVFSSSEDETEVLLLTHKTHLLDITDPFMTAISPSYSEFVLNKARQVAGQPGFIFYDDQVNALTDLQKKSFQILTLHTEYKVVERSANEVVFQRIGMVSAVP